MVKDKLSKKNWFIITLFCFMGGIARKTPKSRVPITEVQEKGLCPYGCARLRMTEMPVLSK